MGCGMSNYTFVIKDDRPNGVYYTGEVVSGHVQLIVDDGHVEIGQIDIALIGEVGYITKRENHGPSSRTGTIYHRLPFLQDEVGLASPNGEGGKLTFKRGRHTFPYQFEIPSNMPPSVRDPHSYPHSRYGLHVRIDNARQQTDPQKMHFLTVVPYVSISQYPQCLQPTSFENPVRKDVTIRGNLRKSGYVPGEHIQGTLEVYNPKRTFIKDLSYSLVEKHRIGNATREQTIIKDVLPEFTQRQDAQAVQPFSIPIPTTSILPTFQFEGGDKVPTQVHVTHHLKFSLSTAEGFTNCDVTIPIVIAFQ